MLKIVGIMLSGVLFGWLLRHQKFLYIQYSITFLIWLLLFTLGLEVGSDQEVIKNLPTLGGQAVFISLLATILAILSGWLLWNLGKKPTNEKLEKTTENLPQSSLFKRIWGQFGDNIIILLIFIAGIFVGTRGSMQAIVEANITLIMLYFLMFMVGFSVGNNSDTLSQFKQIPRRILFLPFLSILGSLAGGAIAGLILHQDIYGTIAVSAGQAYYSLSSVIITDQVGAALGAVALLANIFRELFTVLLSPIIVRLFGPLAVISSGGATTMDVTLPFILKSSGPQYLVTSIYHGFICDFSVPFLVTFFASRAVPLL